MKIRFRVLWRCRTTCTSADGLRTQKQYGTTTYNYYYVDGRLVRMTWINSYIDFLYDESGEVYSIVYDGTQYYFVKNLQGDVVQIRSVWGTKLVEYEYDAWGNCEVVYSHSSYGDLAEFNPIRYRGYYYDFETGFYYLESRYYDPQVKRFISADDVSYLGADGSPLSYNLYTFCLNNPVNRFEIGGNWSLPNWAKVAVGAVATVASVGLTVATGGAATPLLIAVAASTLSSAAIGYVTGGTQGMIDGAADGFMWGGIGALGSSIVSSVPKMVKAAKAAKAADADIMNALKQLDASGLRPGQTTLSRSRVNDLVKNFDPMKANSSVYSNGGTRFLVEGHHTTVASTILGKGTCMNMGTVTSQLPSATNIYWTKHWYEFGKTAIKLIN